MRPILFCFLVGFGVIDSAQARPFVTVASYSTPHALGNPFQVVGGAQAATAPQGTTNGLSASYFDNGTLAGSPLLTRVDATIDFQWGAGSPAITLPKDYFSIRWEGLLAAPTTGSYTFAIRSGNAVRLWVNGKKVLDTWTKKSTTDPAKVPVSLAAGEKTTLKLEYYAGEGEADIQLQWTPPGQAPQVIPSVNLYPVGSPTTPDPTVISQQPVVATKPSPSPQVAPQPATAEKAVLKKPAVASAPVKGSKNTAQSARASKPVAVLAPGVYTLKARANGTPLEVTEESWSSAGVPVTSPTPTASSQWEIQNAGEGYYRLQVQGGNKVLEVLGSATNNGAPMNLWRYYSGNNQLWQIEPVGDGYYKLIAKHSHKALTAKDSTEKSIQQWRYNGRPEQQWKLEPAVAALAAPPAAADAAPGIGANKMRVYPNPSNGVVQLNYQMDEALPLGWVLYDQRGVVVRVSDYRRQIAGPHNQTLNLTSLPAGDYNLHLTVGTATTQQPLIIRRPKAETPETQPADTQTERNSNR